MINFDQVRKNQKLTYQHLQGGTKYKLMFKRVVKFGDEKTLHCKVQGNPDWYKEVYITQDDFLVCQKTGHVRVRVK